MKLRQDEYYISCLEEINAHPDCKFGDYRSDDGTVQEKLIAAFRDDFDQNGTQEQFLLISVTYYDDYYDQYYNETAETPPLVFYLCFVPSEGEAQCLTYYINSVTSVHLLDYGMCKHLIVESNSTTGAFCHTELFGVDRNRAVEYYSQRGEFIKEECFLGFYGWMGAGDFMYYDTSAKEYRAILGEYIPLETIIGMDSTGVLDKYHKPDESLEYFEAVLVCNKFYMFGTGVMMNAYGEPHLYENGAFVHCAEEYNVRRSHMGWYDINSVIYVDYDSAVNFMLSPEQAANCT